MPWTKNDYPDSFKNMENQVRNKAIEIANALLRDGYDEGRAIPIAMEKAREFVGGNKDQEVYTIESHEKGWQLKKEAGERAIYIEDTKQSLIKKAKPYVNEQNGVLKIYHTDGSLEDTLYEYD
ncbi:DUF2188 domain-containing protein [Peribacillus alkalitolerans]|uniref:DUF2188 domain-containing protein n=1 Tax=Peribacillus alkalitolerans TaxID=1550385 RepID=UPI0013D71D8E|nr:DUF2188 domain-containing protein [Peribacillus alkalitolerans]